jgi:acetyl esterase/lipase
MKILKLSKWIFLLIVLQWMVQPVSGEIKVEQPGSKGQQRYVDTVFDQVSIEKDIVFGQSVNEKGETEVLKLDVYSPVDDHLKKRPVIFWIHGGGFTFGNDKSQKYIVEMATRFAKKGYVGVSVDYRLRAKPKDTPKETIADAVEDVLKGLEWLRKNSGQLKIDASKIVVAGGSAGGMLGCHLCLNDRPNSRATEKAGVVAFVNLWGSPAPMWGELQIDKNDPPTIIVHGTADKLVDYQNSVILAEKLTAASVKNQLITIHDAGHTPVAHMDDFEKKIADFLVQLIR